MKKIPKHFVNYLSLPLMFTFDKSTIYYHPTGFISLLCTQYTLDPNIFTDSKGTIKGLGGITSGGPPNFLTFPFGLYKGS